MTTQAPVVGQVWEHTGHTNRGYAGRQVEIVANDNASVRYRIVKQPPSYLMKNGSYDAGTRVFSAGTASFLRHWIPLVIHEITELF